MKTFLNQLKWDFRRISLLWILWIVLLSTVGILRFAVLVSDQHVNSLDFIWEPWAPFTLTILGTLLAARLLFSTPFAGENCYWRTLPLKNQILFLQKVTLLLVLIVLPLIAFILLPFACFVPRWNFVSEYSTCLLYTSPSPRDRG